MNESPIILKILSLAGLVLAIMIHEVAHGVAALACGDPTARDSGRLSLNPIRHIDLVGSIIVPLFLAITGSGIMFGWAKPVPISLYRCRNPKRALWITALAGPLSNLVQALLAVAVLWLVFPDMPYLSGWMAQSEFPEAFMKCFRNFLIVYLRVNIVLMAFNMIPFPPLDGSRILLVLLPRSLQQGYMALERYGLLILIVLMQGSGIDQYLGFVQKSFLQLMGLDWLT